MYFSVILNRIKSLVYLKLSLVWFKKKIIVILCCINNVRYIIRCFIKLILFIFNNISFSIIYDLYVLIFGFFLFVWF